MAEQMFFDIETGKYLAHLVKSALDDVAPLEISDKTDWRKVFFAARNSSLEGISFLAVDKLQNKPDEKIYSRWKNIYLQIVYREMRFDFERQAIFAKMSEIGLSYLPLKGINLLRFYPKEGMRSMCDNDILYGEIEEGLDGVFHVKGKTDGEQKAFLKDAQNKLIDVMTSLGFDVGSLFGHDERFTKGDLLFEMHRSLVPEDCSYYSYYKNSWQRAVQNVDVPSLFAYSREDEYIYTVVHIDKHLKTSGTGLRSIVDLYVFLKNSGNSLNRTYIDGELEKLGLADVEKRLRTFAFDLFEKNELSSSDEDMLRYFLNCGTYGNFDEMMRQNLNRLGSEKNSGKAKSAYVKNRLFNVPEENMKRVFPLFYKHKALRPFLPVYRVLRGMFTNSKKFFGETRYLLTKSKDKKDR